MSWVPDESVTESYSWLETILIRILKCGRIPEHVAFIMDGNRRFARENGIEKIEGHSQGFDKLAQTLQWCNDFGVKEVTVYAFSIENYKRPQNEVDGLFDLAREKFKRVVREKDKLQKYGIRINILGNLSLLPDDLRELALQVQKITSEHSPLTLNIAFSYTAREEMAQAIKLTLDGVERQILEPEDITEQLIERCLYTRMSPQPDLLIRTSGEVRLSDFLLWQSAYSVIFFTRVLWPDFSLKNLIQGIFYFQMNRSKISSTDRHLEDRQQTDSARVTSTDKNCDESSKSEERISKFLQNIDSQRRREFERVPDMQLDETEDVKKNSDMLESILAKNVASSKMQK